MKKPLEEMTSAYSIYNFDFRNSVAEHDLSAGKDINEKKYFLFVEPLYYA